MNDRELLEAAARAYWGDEIDDVVSVEWSERDDAILYTHADNQDHNGQDQAFCWSPLTDDGDALRLAVKLNITVFIYDDETSTALNGVVAKNWGSKEANTRRAIVRAAAALQENRE
jgi:hypothetical protein